MADFFYESELSWSNFWCVVVLQCIWQHVEFKWHFWNWKGKMKCIFSSLLQNYQVTCISYKVQKFCSYWSPFFKRSLFAKNLARRDLLRHFCRAWCRRLLKKRSIATRLRERLVDHYSAWLCFIGEECGFFMLNSWEPCRIVIGRSADRRCALAQRTVAMYIGLANWQQMALCIFFCDCKNSWKCCCVFRKKIIFVLKWE